MTDPIGGLSAAFAGRYRIERELGTGGMATVYLAEDLKHDRQVAIKVLKPELAAVLGAERFVVEIKTTASLSHPHILPLFDSGTAAAFLYYVMPYIEGETIREKLNRESQFGVDEAVRIAREVADALDYAHRHGVIHRDIKPENILLHDGRAMVMDFGIALALSAAAGGRMTETGLSLGTPHYMSPEQATAEKDITPRSDIYSLGSVLYEMLAGEPPHVGNTAQAVIMKIITDDARPVNALRKSVPPNVVASVAKALEKLPADRFESAKAFGDALANPAFGEETAATMAGRATGAGGRGAQRGWRARVWQAAAGASLVLASIAGAGWWRNTHGGDTAPTVRFPLTMPAGIRIGGAATGSGGAFAVSPDGRTVAFVASGAGTPRTIFIRSLNDPQPRALRGTEGASAPFFSPDGRWLGFFGDSRLKKVPVDGGAVIAVTDRLGGFISGGSWGPNDQIALAVDGELALVSAAGGMPRPITKADTVGQRLVRWPRFLADGKTVVYTSWVNTNAAARIGATSLESGKSTVLDLPGTYPLGVLDGRLFYVSTTSAALMAVPFDTRAMRPKGPAVQVLESVVKTPLGSAHVALSPAGTLVYQSGATALQVVLSDTHGVTQSLISDPRDYSGVRYSPDGRRVALSIGAGASNDVWIYDIASRTLTRLTTEGANNDRPEWTPDSRRVLYRTDRGGGYSLWWQPVDGSAPAEQLLRIPGRDIWEGMIAPDGKTLVYRAGSLGSADIWYRAITGDTTPKPIATSKFNEWAPRVSPDGHWVAYGSDESGAFEVYVRPFPGPGPRTQVSANGGDTPLWTRDGKRVYYTSGQQLLVATVSLPAAAGAAQVVRRDTLFSGDFALLPGHPIFDVAPDGTHLLVIKPAGGDVQNAVVVNWLAEVRAGLNQPGRR